MRRPLLSVILVACPVLACGTGAEGSGGMSVGDDTSDGGEPREEIPGIVAAHNEVRDTVGVPHLSWDDGLGGVAQRWADRCAFVHSTGEYGENLYASTPAGGATARSAVDAWAAEVEFYTYDTNTCVPGEQCGHYTQIVWDTTERVGCGFAFCPESSSPFGPGFGEWELWVCNYDPPGNWVGEKPY